MLTVLQQEMCFMFTGDDLGGFIKIWLRLMNGEIS